MKRPFDGHTSGGCSSLNDSASGVDVFSPATCSTGSVAAHQRESRNHTKGEEPCRRDHDDQTTMYGTRLQERTAVSRAPAVRRHVAWETIPHAAERIRDPTDCTGQPASDPLDGRSPQLGAAVH